MSQSIKLSLTEKQFLVIHEFLFNTKLGDRNKFESEISDLMADMDNDVTRFTMELCVKKHGLPKIGATIDEDGLVFQVS
jgi:hypothetical protein